MHLHKDQCTSAPLMTLLYLRVDWWCEVVASGDDDDGCRLRGGDTIVRTLTVFIPYIRIIKIYKHHKMKITAPYTNLWTTEMEFFLTCC
jgi:hypothetical protein